MKMRCAECKQKSEDGILEHLDTCSTNNFVPKIHTDYLRPPATIIEFDNKEEERRFNKAVNSGEGFTIKSPTKSQKKGTKG